jgi:hypothetical protein
MIKWCHLYVAFEAGQENLATKALIKGIRKRGLIRFKRPYMGPPALEAGSVLVRDRETGLAIRAVQQYDPVRDKLYRRFDVIGSRG